MNNIVKNVSDSYKKSPVKFIAVTLLVLIGLIFSWYITLPLVIVVYLSKKFKREEESKKGTKKVCPHCKTEIDWGATKCPHCHGKIYVWTSDKKIVLTVLVLLFSIGVLKIGSSTPSTSSPTNTTESTPSPEQVARERKTISIVFAEDVIKKILKAPSTAKFVDVEAYELSTEKDVWAVNGYVDSQNSFGAMIRNQWEVQLDYREGKGGTVKSILFDGQKML